MNKPDNITGFINNILNFASDISNYINTDKIDGQYDRIIFIGAHGTGKTTLANELAELLCIPVVESVAREFKKDMKYLESAGVFVFELNTPRTRIDAQQHILCSMARWDFMRWVKADIPCIMTRSPLDTLAYAMVDSNVNSSTYSTNLEILENSNEFKDAVSRSLFIYLPIEFEIQSDGVRPTDKEYQKRVDEAIRRLIYMFKITPLVVTGTVEERLEQILVKTCGKYVSSLLMHKYNASKTTE